MIVLCAEFVQLSRAPFVFGIIILKKLRRTKE